MYCNDVYVIHAMMLCNSYSNDENLDNFFSTKTKFTQKLPSGHSQNNILQMTEIDTNKVHLV